MGQEGFEATAGTLGTYELTGHTDSVVAVGFNHSGRCVASLTAPWQLGVRGTCDSNLLLPQP